MSVPSTPRFLALATLVLPAAALAQSYVDLDFRNNVQPASGIYPNNSTLGPYYVPGNQVDFTNAGSFNGHSIDVRASMIGLTDGESSNFRDSSTYGFTGWIPDYNPDTTPSNDLGVYYAHDGNMSQLTGGIAWTLSFYEGGSNFATPITLPAVRFLIYDHDGEQYQSESIRAFEEDGFAGYQLHNSSGIGVQDEDGTWRFDAAGVGQSETGPGGGMILYYENASSIRFDLFATTNPNLLGANNGVFGAWDGDLSLINKDTQNFGGYVSVPEPSSMLLFGSAVLGSALRRRRC